MNGFMGPFNNSPLSSFFVLIIFQALPLVFFYDAYLIFLVLEGNHKLFMVIKDTNKDFFLSTIIDCSTI